MNDPGDWAKIWLADLVGNGAFGVPGTPDLSGPLVLHDRRCTGVAPWELHEQLRELRRPVADGVPKQGRYAVVHQQPWSGQDALWMEAAEYGYGMFGARFVFVQQVRRGPGGELVAVGDPVELPDGSPAGRVTSVRDAVGSRLAGVRRAWRDRSRHAVDSGPPARALADGRLHLRRMRRPALVVCLVWGGLVLAGLLSAIWLTGSGSPMRSLQAARTAAKVAPAPVVAAVTPSALSGTGKPVVQGSDRPAPGRPETDGDLGLAVPISRPSCDGGYGVIIASVVRPELYERDISTLLARYSGSSYLLAEQTCPSLRARTDAGNSIYAVYYGPYETLGNACATRKRIGAGSYVRRLDNTDSRGRIIRC